jgi:hypothetical protein
VIYAGEWPWELTRRWRVQRRAQADNEPSWYPVAMPRPDPHQIVPPMYGHRTRN